MDELRQLVGEAERMGTVLDTGRNPDARYAGQDATETVAVVVDTDGRVVDVTIDRDKFRAGDLRLLAAATLEAAGNAETARVSDWAERITEADATLPAVEVPASPPVSAPFQINPPRVMLDQVLTLIHRASEESSAELRRAEALAAAPRRPITKGRSEGGHVVVGMDGQRVVRVEIETDTSWIATANEREIAAELRDAFAEAYRNLDDAAPRRRANSAIDELRKLTENPQEFVNTLFGINR
ncbi:hypothetical protein [Actinophytocola sediminis]